MCARKRHPLLVVLSTTTRTVAAASKPLPCLKRHNSHSASGITHVQVMCDTHITCTFKDEARRSPDDSEVAF